MNLVYEVAVPILYSIASSIGFGGYSLEPLVTGTTTFPNQP